MHQRSMIAGKTYLLSAVCLAVKNRLDYLLRVLRVIDSTCWARVAGADGGVCQDFGSIASYQHFAEYLQGCVRKYTYSTT